MQSGKSAVVVAGYRTQRAPILRGRARWILSLAASVTVAGIAPALALGGRVNHVDVKNVAAGSARFSERGSVMTVRAADRTVINYRRFDIDPGGTVRFIQPSRDSRVLNRIDAVAPSKIDGKLLANGSVYFVNPAGVTFGPNAIVNVGKIYAAAGNISDSDFLGGVDRFTVSGELVNQGQVSAQTVALIGRRVSNLGVVDASVVMMAAGDEVIVGPRDGQVFVKVSAADAAQDSGAGAGFSLGSGDLYSLVVRSGGTVKAKTVTVQSGGSSEVPGTIDASDRSSGARGGDVQVLGERVSVTGSIDASGSAGGGNVLIGGAFHGGNGVPTATQTEVGAAAVISADAIDQGDGGSVAVWSDALTIYSGNIYARGGAQGGNGGFVEVSSKQQLNFGGSVSTAAPAGLGGTLLLDPADIKIVAPGLEDSDEQVGDNVVLHGESAGDTFSISKNTVNGLNGTVVLQATNDISIEANLDLDADTLVLQAGNDISISHHVKFNAAGTGKRLHIEADSPHTGSVSDGAGSVTINGDIDANGGNVVLMGAGFTINNDIKANSVELSLSQPGALTITAGALGHLIGTNVTIGRATSAGDNGLGGITATTSTVTALNVEAFDHDTTHLTLISGGHLTFSGNVTAATVTALAGQTTDGTLSFAGTPTAIKADEITLQAGVGSGTGSLVVTTNGVFTSTDGNDRPAKFVLSQDANLVDSTLPDPTTQFPKGVPTDYQVGSLGGFLNLTDATKFQDPLGIGPQEPQLSLSAKGGVTLAPVGALSLASLSMTGTAVTVGALSSTGNITLTGIGSGAGEGNVTVAGAISGGGNFIIRASGDALVDFSVTAPVIDVAGGTDDSGNVVLGSLAAIQLLADAQTYTAGTDSGTGGTNKIDIDSAKFGSMTAPPANWSLALVQDAKATDAAGDPTLPAPATGFVAGLPTTFVVRSRDDAVEITSVLDNDKTALTVSGLSTVKIKGGKLKLIDVQLGDALLGGNLTLTQTASFAHKLDADSGVVTAELEVGDNATFTGSVGSTATLPPLVKVNVKGFTTFGAQASKVNVTTQHYEKQVTLGTSATFSGTNATFAGGIKGVGGPSATFAFTETVKLNGAETIVDLTSNGLGGTTDLSGTISTSGDQVYNTGVSLSGAVVIQADSVSFKHITGAQPLKVEGVGGAATADATFGGIVSTQSLWVRGKSRINAISITTTGFQTYAGDVTLGAGTTGLKGDTLRFGGKIDGATAGESALVLEATNAGNPLVRFDQAVGTVALGQLSVTGKTTVDGGAVKTVQVAGTFDGKQIYTDTVTLGGPTLFQGTTAAFPAIDGTVVSKHNLTLNFSGNQSISGTTLLNIGDLDTDALGTTTITGSLTTERTQTYRDPVKLTGAATTLKGTIISLLNTADATVVAGQNLTVDGSAVLGSSVNTTGTQVYNGPVQLTGAGSGTHTLTASLVNTKSTVSVAPGAGVRSLAVVGNAQLDANVTTSGRQTYSGAVTINGATVTLTTPLSLGFGDVVDSALAGTNTLKIDAPLSTFAGNVGSTKALLALDVDSAASLGGGSYTTTGAQTYRQNVTLAGGGLAADQVVKAAQTTFSGKINASGSTQSLKLEGLASAVTFENSVGFDDPLKSLRVEGTSTIGKTGGSGEVVVQTLTSGLAGTQQYVGQLTLKQDAVLIGTTATFSAVDGLADAAKHDLDLVFSGAIDVSGTVFVNLKDLVTDDLSKLTIVSQQFTLNPLNPAGNKTRLTGTITTSGKQVYNDPLELVGAAPVTLIANPSITFNHTVTSTTAGVLEESLVAQAAAIAINGTGVKAQVQRYDGDVMLGGVGEKLLTGHTRFAGTVKAQDDGVQALAVTKNATFAGSVGTPFDAGVPSNLRGRPKSLNMQGTTVLHLAPVASGETRSITTTGNQTYAGNVTLNSNAAFEGDNATFGGNLNANLLNVDLNFSGIAKIGANFQNLGNLRTDVAGFVPAASLNPNKTQIDGNVTTTGTQIYRDDVELLASLTLRSQGTVGISFEKTLYGTSNLIIDAVDATTGVTFGGVVGVPTKLTTMDVKAKSWIGGGEVHTTGYQKYYDTITLQADTTLKATDAGATVTFAGTINGGETQAYSLTVDADNTHVLDDVGWPQTAGSERPLLDLTITGKTTLAGTSTNTVNTVNGQTYAGSVLLAADQELSGESMWFQSAVDGTFALTVNGTTTFDGFVGASPALKSLQANGHVQMNGGGVTTTTYQTYAGSVTLGNGAVLTGSDVTFEDKVDAGSDGGQGLIVDVTSRATINDLVGDDQRLLDLWVKGTGSAHINGGFIDTKTTQLYDVPVTLGASAELVGSTITFNKTVDGASSGAQALEIVGNTGGEGNAEFNAPVGSDVALEHVHVEGTTKMNAGTVDTTGDQDYDGAVTLWKDTTLTLSDPPSVASFHSTVDGLNDGTQLLLINGNAFFGDSAGAGINSRLESLMIHGHADVNGQEIKTASFQTYDGTLTLRSDQPFGEADKTFTGSIVTFNQTVDAMNDGVQALTLNASEMHAHGAIGGAVGGPTRLEFLHVNATSFLYDGNVTTTDDQVYNGIVNLKADGKLNGTDITFKGKVHDLDVDKWKLTATGSGTTTFEANVGDEGKRLLAVLHNGAGGLANSVFGKMIGGTPISVSTKQTQTYLNRSTLAVDLTLNASTVTFGRQPRADGQVDAKDAGQQFLLVNADAVFHGDVGKNQPLESLTVTGKTQIDTLLIKTTGNQWYQQAVTLGPAISDVDLVLNPSSTAIFGGTLDASGDGQQSLDISGNADFGQDVGEIHDLTFLTVSQDTILRGSKITTTTYQSFAGAMTLAGTLNKTLTGTTVTFGTESGGSGVRGKVDSANDGIGPRSLTIVANAVFNGNVGTQPPSIQFLDVKGNTTLTAQQITSVGFQKYQGSFTLRGTPANKQLNAASVTFGNPGAAAPFGVVDATNAGVQSLEINAANTTFNGVVGTNVAPLSLTVNGDSRINAPTIKTTSFQKYKGNVVLGPNHSDITSIPGNITTFGGTIAASASGAQGLKVDGNVQFDGDVGTVPLSYLNVVQTTLLNAKNVTTTGNQTYNGSVTLGGGGSTAEKLLTGANVLFNKSVSAQSNGVQAMTIKANQVTFNGEVGGQPPGTSKLKFLFIDADTTMNGKFITSTTYQTYDGNVTLASDMLLTGTLLTFEGTINGAKALNIDGNLATFNGDVGTGTALASMTVDAEALLNATTFKSTGVQHYLQKVTLAKAPAVNIIASSTLFDTTVDAKTVGAQGLDVTGAVTFGKLGAGFNPVGGNAALAFLNVKGIANINGGAITTTGNQSFPNPDKIFLGSSTTLTTSSGSLVINPGNILNGGNFNLTLNIGGTDTVGSNFTNIHDLLTDNRGNTVLFGNVNTSGFQKYLDPVTLSADTTLTTPDAAHVLFDKTVDSATGGNRKLDVTSGVTTFVGNVGVSSALTSLLVKGKAQLSTSVGITVHTQGSQTYEGGAVTLGTSATLQLDNDLAAATFKDTVDGGKLEIEGVGGNAVFKKAVGLTDPLTSLSVEKTSAIDGGFVETTGFQTYAGAVTLGADTELKTGANIGFGSTLDAKAAGEQSLTINAGSTTFGGLVGFNDALEFLDVTGTATLNADSITTELHQTYRNTLTLAADATLHATSISFAGVEGQSHNLTLDASDTVSQNAQAIRAGDVALMGGGRFVLNNLANDIASVHTVGTEATARHIELGDINGFAVGADGLRVSRKNKRKILLASDGEVTQVGPVVATQLSLAGGGSFELVEKSNLINRLHIDMDGSAHYVNSKSLTVLSGAEADKGVDISTVSGNLTVGAINAPGGIRLAVDTGLTSSIKLTSDFKKVDPLSQVPNVFEPVNLIFLNGDLSASGGTITLGDPFKTNVPSRASIIASPGLSFTAANMTMRRGQKMSAMGDLTITVDGVARLSDINALGALIINANSLEMVKRPGSHIIAFDPEAVTDHKLIVDAKLDDGADLVGTDVTVNLGNDGPPTFVADVDETDQAVRDAKAPDLPPFSAVSFSDVDGAAARPYDGVILDGAIDPRALNFDNVGLMDLKAEGQADANLGTSFAMALPAEMPTPQQEAEADPAQRKALLQMGINAKDLGAGIEPSEFLEWMVNGRGLYDDLVKKRPQLQDVDFRVTSKRLQRPRITEIYDIWQEIYCGTDRPKEEIKRLLLQDDNTEIKAVIQARADNLKGNLEKAVREFVKVKKWDSSFDAQGMAALRQFIDETPKYQDVRHNLDRLAMLLNKIEALGLSQQEYSVSRERLLGWIKPKVIDDPNWPFEKLVMPGNQQLGSARNGHSTSVRGS